MLTLLLIEDNIDLLELLTEFLRLSGYTVVPARDGNEGVRLFQEGRFDLVITDLLMPEKEGLQTIVELRKKVPDLKIIAMSGGGKLGGERYLSLAAGLGVNKTLMKPFGLAEFNSAIKEVLALAPR